MFTYLNYHPKFQKSIQTTNRIEAVNQKIKRLISHKQQFPNNESFERILVSGLVKMNITANRRIPGIDEHNLTNKIKL